MPRRGEDTKKLRDILKPLIESALRGVTILAVNLRRSENAYGDPVLWVTVVYDGTGRKGKPLDSKITTRMHDRVIPKLRQAGEEAFPVFSYVAKSDLGRTKPDAA
jgi:hypothetical protein